MATIKRNIALLICSCVLLGGFGPQRGLLAVDCGSVAGILSNQPLLQYYFTLSDIPVRIVNKIFLDNSGFNATAKKQSKKERRDNRDNTSADYSLAGSFTSGSGKYLSRAEGSGIGGMMHAVPFMHARPGLNDGPGGLASRCAPGFGAWLMLLLMLFIVLPRGGLEDSIRLMEKYIFDDPIWKRPNWVFHFGGNR